jgi:hypothetical protein
MSVTAHLPQDYKQKLHLTMWFFSTCNEDKVTLFFNEALKLYAEVPKPFKISFLF